MSNPGPVHWQALKHLVRYLKGTQALGLFYDFSKPSQVQGLHGYTDASYADCPDTSKSTVGYVFYYGTSILSWFSKLHTFVTTCTNHSEYAALAYGAKEAQWMVYLFDALEPQIKHTPVPLFVDNSGVVSMVFNPVDHQSNKHIRISCHYARELTQEQLIAPQRVPTDKNLADIFTKPLGGAAFKALVGNFVWPVVGKPAELLQNPERSVRSEQNPVVFQGGIDAKSQQNASSTQQGSSVRGGVLGIAQVSTHS
jgi:hypothetical protein